LELAHAARRDSALFSPSPPSKLGGEGWGEGVMFGA